MHKVQWIEHIANVEHKRRQLHNLRNSSFGFVQVVYALFEASLDHRETNDVKFQLFNNVSRKPRTGNIEA